MIKHLIKLSDHLDKKGFSKEADYLDAIMKKYSSFGSSGWPGNEQFGRHYDPDTGQSEAPSEEDIDKTYIFDQLLKKLEEKGLADDFFRYVDNITKLTPEEGGVSYNRDSTFEETIPAMEKLLKGETLSEEDMWDENSPLD